MKLKSFNFLFHILLIVFFSQTSFVKTECVELEERLLKSPIDFNYPIEDSFTDSGLELYFKENESPEVISIHPLSEVNGEIINKETYDLIFSTPLRKINNIEVSRLSEDEFYEELDKKIVQIDLEGVETSFNFKRKEFQDREIIIVPALKDLRNIDTKNGTFEIFLEWKVYWNDSRISQEVIEIADSNNGSFQCDFPYELFDKKLRYYLPKPHMIGFSSDFAEENPKKININYYPPEMCDEDCDEQELKYGVFQIYFFKNFKGTINSSYDFNKFPFDSQELIIEGYLRNVDEVTFDSLYLEIDADKYLKNAFSNLSSQEWRFLNYDSTYGSIYEVETGWNIPSFKLEISVERQNLYFIFKIMFPILCLVFICYSVFWIHPMQLESRVTISIVCLLSLIAYNFVVDGDIPRLSYLTFLDQFILISYLFAGLPTVQTVFSRRLFDINENQAIRFDVYSRIIFPISYFLLIFILVTYSF